MAVAPAVQKKWGEEFWLVNNELYCCKILRIFPGGHSSLHYHRQKDETFIVQKGSCCLTIGDNASVTPVRILQAWDVVRIYPGSSHQFWVPGDLEECIVLEVSTHHDEEDVVRLSESWAEGGNMRQKGEI